MRAARRTVALFRRTHQTTQTVRASSSIRPMRDQLLPSLSQPRNFFTTPPVAGPHPGSAIPATTCTSRNSFTMSSSSKSVSKSLSIGLASGTLGAMCGIGGAVFAIPALVRFTALPQRVAAGNSLAAVTAVALAGTVTFYSESAVDFSIAVPLALSASLLTPIGARLARSVDALFLRRAFGAFMILLAPILPLRSYLLGRKIENPGPKLLENKSPGTACVMAASRHDDGVKDPTATTDQFDLNLSRRTMILSSSGAAIGLTSGLLGISGGSLFTPLIALLCPDMPFTSVMGTSFAAMIVPTTIGALSYARMRMIAPALLPALVIGAAIGARFGANFAFAVPDVVLHYGFATVFAFMGLRTLKASALLNRGVKRVAGKC